MKFSTLLFWIFVIPIILFVLNGFFMWFVSLVVTLIAGFLLSSFLKIFKVRPYFSLLMIPVVFLLPIFGIAESTLSFYVVTALFALSTLTFVLKKFKADKSEDHTEIEKFNADLPWTAIFANGFQMMLLHVTPLRTSLPIQMESLDFFLYLNYIIFLIMPFISKRINLKSRSSQKRAVRRRHRINLTDILEEQRNDSPKGTATKKIPSHVYHRDEETDTYDDDDLDLDDNLDDEDDLDIYDEGEYEDEDEDELDDIEDEDSDDDYKFTPQEMRSDAQLIDINRATEDDFIELGLGIVQAKKLISHRQQIGQFESTDAFIKFIKVPPNTLLSITGRITCTPIKQKKQKYSGRRLEL